MAFASRDPNKRDADHVDFWLPLFERALSDFVRTKYKSRERYRQLLGQYESEIKSALKSEGGRNRLRESGWSEEKMRREIEQAVLKVVENSVRTTNPIVQKAMNAEVRNYDVKPGWTNRWSGELKQGTKIMVVDSPIRYGGMAGEVVRRDGPRYVVRLDDIAGMEVRLNPNQISVKNAVSDAEIERRLIIRGADRYGENPNMSIKFFQLPESKKEEFREIYKELLAKKVNSYTEYMGGHNWEVLLRNSCPTNAVVSNAAKTTNAVVRKALNSATTNREFKPGDKVCIGGRAGRERGETVETIERVEGEGREKMLFFEGSKWGVPARMYAYANAEDAQGHEHGSDGKFTSKGGGGKKDADDQHSRIDSLLAKAESGEDGYEDPKTKRMRERLEKMRAKTEALRKENEQRRAALAGKKAELEKMRADVMKANVEKWKAGIPKTKNAVVAKALNAQLHDYEVPVVKRGVKSTVTIRRVADEETAKKLASDPLTGTEVDASRSVSVLNAEAVCNERYLVQTLEGDRWETKKTTSSRMDADSYMRVYQRSYGLSDVRILRASDGAEIARG